MMKTGALQIKKILVTGESPYLERHNFLFQALSSHVEKVETLERQPEWYEERIARLVLKYLYTLRVFSRSKADTLFQKNSREFIAKSLRFEHRIQQLNTSPDFVLHIFNTFSPFWNINSIPYAVYLDYTMALSKQSQLPWAYFIDQKEQNQWMACERQLFQRAKYLFTQSQLVKNSLISSYEIEPEKIIVVGASGNFLDPYKGEKNFGTQRLLFNGSDFQRKGGDLVLAAFQQVKRVLPNAKLTVIGRKLLTQPEGVENPGHVSPSELKNLFLNTDLVLAPAQCDPFPRFVMEAMNYGVPCVVSNRDGMPEIVDHEINGVVMDELTPDQLADTLIELLSDPNRLAEMSQAAQHKIRTQLNWNVVAHKMMQTFVSKSLEGATHF